MSGIIPDETSSKGGPSKGASLTPPLDPKLGLEQSVGDALKKRDSSESFVRAAKFDAHRTPDAVLKEYRVRKVSWADLVEAEEVDGRIREKIESVKNDLLYSIRSKSSLATENRILVPGNLKRELPKFWEKLSIAAQLAKCELVDDPSVSVELARKQVFGDDVAARDQVLASLYQEGGKPKKELVCIADFTALMDSVLEIPDPEEMSAPLGKAGTFHTFALFIRVYCEQKFSTPISKQKNWWKGGNTIREDMVDRLKTVIGNTDAALCIMNAFDVLYRKFIRSVFQTGDTEKMQKLENLAKLLSKKMFVTGGGLFQNLLHVETRTRKVTVDVLKGGRAKKETREEKYLARVKPNILDGPKTTLEKTVVAKINSVLAKTDVLAVDYDLESKKFDSPEKWEDAHKVWVEGLYTKSKVASNEIVRRKQLIRSLVAERRAEKLRTTPGMESTSVSPNQPISVEEWRSAECEVLSRNSEKFESALEEALSKLFGNHRNLDEYLAVDEDVLLDELDDPSD